MSQFKHRSTFRLLFFITVLLLTGSTVWGQQEICFGSIHTYQVDENENGGEGTLNSVYNWDVISSDFLGTITNTTSSGNQIEIDWEDTPQGTYTLIVTENNQGCINTKQLEVTVKSEIPIPHIENQLICPNGGTATFSINDVYDSYIWYNQNGDILSNTPTLTVDQTGVYTVKVGQNGCSLIQTVEAISVDVPTFIANTTAFNTIIVESTEGIMGNVQYQLEDLDGNILVHWQTDNVFQNIKKGIYIVKIKTINNSTECYTQITATTIDIPNVITPNGDGLNDTWNLSGLLLYAPNAKIEIFDRYGKKITTLSESNNFKWNGKYLGQPLPSTSYAYIMIIGETKITGWITIKNK